MALPDNLAQVWVVGQLLRDDGTPQRGRVTFLPSTNALVDQANDVTVATWAPFVAVLSASGTFAVKLPATDAPGWTPTGWTYQVREPIRRSYHLAVPAATPVLNDPDGLLHGQRVMDLSDAVPLPEANAGTVQVIAPEPASPEQIAAAVEGYLDQHPPDGELAERVTELDMEQDAHHVRLDGLEAASDDVPDLISAAVTVHRQAAAPHPAYDDLPSLRLLFENGLI